MRRLSGSRTAPALVAAALLGVGLLVTPASAGGLDPSTNPPPTIQDGPLSGSADQGAGAGSSCSTYGSSSGFGLLCNTASGGKTLAQILTEAGIDVTKKFCWDDRDLPEGFVPPVPQPGGTGTWFLHTCLSFDGLVTRTGAKLEYEFDYHEPGQVTELTGQQQTATDLVTGRGQMPFLQVQATPLSSPRSNQRIAFSLLCDSTKVTCTDTGTITTPELDIGGITMFAEVVHLRVLPEGKEHPSLVSDCTGGGIPQTAEQLDAADPEAKAICDYTYDRSSDGAGGGLRQDRYAAQVTAYWQIYVRDAAGVRTFGDAFEKTTINQIRVTEVQTLVVS